MSGPPKPRDIALLDAIDACARESFQSEVWRVVRDGRDPLQPSASRGRWSNGSFDVLYTALERDGAISEIFAMLSAQPVFPSQMQWWVHKMTVELVSVLNVQDVMALEQFGVETGTYAERSYDKTQAIADAAYFLGFDGLVVPSARWGCQNLVIFSDRITPSQINLTRTDTTPIDWAAWHRTMKG